MNQAALRRNAHLEATGLLLVSKSGFRDAGSMEEERKPRFSLTMWIVLIFVGVVFLGLSCPMVIRSKRDDGRSDTINNARQIGFAMFEFEREYGRFPDETTAEILRQKKGNQWNLGNNSSNDYFRQLIAAGFAGTPAIFYAKTQFTMRSNRELNASEKSLAPGEVGFGYLMNGKSAFNTDGNPARPLACAALAFDGKTVSDRKFDLSVYHEKAVVLRIDNSVTSLPIHKESKLAVLGGGKSLLQTGLDTVWEADAKPVIVPPLPKR